jgi:hypothetical protein
MRRRKLRFGKGFRVVPGNRRSQAAEMALPPGDAEGDPENRHVERRRGACYFGVFCPPCTSPRRLQASEA